MAKRYFKRIPLNGDVNTRSEWMVSGAGSNRVVTNYVQEEDGSARVRPRLNYVTQTGTAIPNGGTSVFWCGHDDATLRGVYVARDNGTSMTIHKADGITGTPTWGSAVIDTITGGSYYLPFVTGNSVVLYGNFDFPSSRLRFWNGTTAAEASTVAIAGRSLAYYKERFWSAGPAVGPHRLYYSGISDHTSWDLNNYIEVGADDGGVIEAIEPVLGGLLIAKQQSLYFLTGNGPSTFALTPLDGGEGFWGKSIVATPYGAVIAGNKDVYLWAGGSVETLSHYMTDYAVGSAWVNTAYLDNSVYITTHGTFTWVYNLKDKRWRRMNTADTAADYVGQVCVGGVDRDNLIFLPRENCNAALNGVSTLHPVDGIRSKDDHNRGYLLQLQTGFQQLSDSAAHMCTPFKLHVLVMQRGTGTGNLDIAVYKPFSTTGGQSIGFVTVPPAASEGYRRIRFTIDPSAPVQYVALHFQTYIGTGSSATVRYDILDAEIEYEVEEAR